MSASDREAEIFLGVRGVVHPGFVFVRAWGCLRDDTNAGDKPQKQKPSEANRRAAAESKEIRTGHRTPRAPERIVRFKAK